LGGARRHRRILRSHGPPALTKNDVRRLARRAGVKRVCFLVNEEARSALMRFLERVLKDAVSYMENARRKTVTTMDIVYALKRRAISLYGFGV